MLLLSLVIRLIFIISLLLDKLFSATLTSLPLVILGNEDKSKLK